jgi:hypothetical protein
MTTSERVVAILTSEGGYRELPRPFKVGSLTFEFTYALIAGERANDLVIVIELKGDSADEAVIRKVLALTRALDVLQSKRPVTAVLTSGQAVAETVQSISRVCRVLTVGSPTGPRASEAVRDWLSVLLPITEPQSTETLLDWEADLRQRLPTSLSGTQLDQLIASAPRGKIAVEETFASSIKTAVTPALEEDEEDHL